MFLIKSQLDNVNTTLILHYYDNRHKDEWIDNWSMNRSHNEQSTIGINYYEANSWQLTLILSFPLKEG